VEVEIQDVNGSIQPLKHLFHDAKDGGKYLAVLRREGIRKLEIRFLDDSAKDRRPGTQLEDGVLRVFLEPEREPNLLLSRLAELTTKIDCSSPGFVEEGKGDFCPTGAALREALLEAGVLKGSSAKTAEEIGVHHPSNAADILWAVAGVALLHFLPGLHLSWTHSAGVAAAAVFVNELGHLLQVRKLGLTLQSEGNGIARLLSLRLTVPGASGWSGSLANLVVAAALGIIAAHVPWLKPFLVPFALANLFLAFGPTDVLDTVEKLRRIPWDASRPGDIRDDGSVAGSPEDESRVSLLDVVLVLSLVVGVATRTPLGYAASILSATLLSYFLYHNWRVQLDHEASVVAALAQAEKGTGGREEASALLAEFLKDDDFSYHLRTWAGPRAGWKEVVDVFSRKAGNPGTIEGKAARRALERQLKARGIPIDGKLLARLLSGVSRNPGDWSETFTGKSLPLFVPPSASDEDLKAVLTVAKAFQATRVLLVVEAGNESRSREAVKAAGAESIAKLHVVADGSYRSDRGSSILLALEAEGWKRLASELPGATPPSRSETSAWTGSPKTSGCSNTGNW
jgi:hypothetical protein